MAPTGPNMPDGQFESLRLELLRGGVTRAYVERTILELAEHYADLQRAAAASGLCADEAARAASETLGNERAIAAAILAHPELLTFSARYPRVAQYLHSAAAIGTLPGLPLIFCLAHRPGLARWGAAVSLAATLMGSVLAGLNWLIVLPY
jgi:hypothetical protein